MSSITFQSVSGEAQIGGRERHFSSGTIKRIYSGLLDVDGLIKFSLTTKNKRSSLGRVLGIIDGNEYSPQMFFEMVSYKLNPVMSLSPLVDLKGWKFNSWHAEMNTALKYGSDEIAFLVRLHAQCEIHGYVAEKNREWLANIIESGLDKKILREESQGYGKGWRDVITLLKNNDGGPVVTSYSVCDSFFGTAAYHLKNCSEENFEDWSDNWYKQTHDVKWKLAVDWLTSQEDGGPEWSPENLRLLFGDGETVDEVRENLMKAVEEEALPACQSRSGYGMVSVDQNLTKI